MAVLATYPDPEDKPSGSEPGEDHLATVIRQALTCAPDPAAVLRRATL